jgi:PmbA protein
VGCRALSLEPGTKSQEEILAEVGEGLLVQEVTGVHSGVNPISGDFSVGAEGLMIRDGALAEPVREITIASTIQRMLLDVVAVGNDLEWLPGAAAGVTIAIAEMSMGGA